MGKKVPENRDLIDLFKAFNKLECEWEFCDAGEIPEEMDKALEVLKEAMEKVGYDFKGHDMTNAILVLPLHPTKGFRICSKV